jgi:hypothetical protein
MTLRARPDFPSDRARLLSSLERNDMPNRSAFKVSGWKWRLADPLVPLWLTAGLLAALLVVAVTS